MEHAIRCLEYELGRKLAEVDEMSRELTELRRLYAARTGVELPDRRVDSIPPAVDPAPSPAPAAECVASSTTGAGDLSESESVDTDPTPAHGTPRPTGSGSKYDYAEVAEIARAAIADGRSAPQAIVDELDAPTTKAASLAMRKARQAGHHIPKVRAGGRPSKAPALASVEPLPPADGPLTAEPIDRTPFDPDAARARAAAAT